MRGDNSAITNTWFGLAAHLEFLTSTMWTPNQYASNHFILNYVRAQAKVLLRCSLTVAVFSPKTLNVIIFFFCVCCLIRECLS